MIKNIIPFIINSDGTKRPIYRPTLRARNTHTNIIQVIAPFDFNTNIGITYSLKNSSADTHTEYAVLTDFKGSDVLSPDRPDYQELADFNVWELTVSHVPLNGIVLNRSYSVDLTFNIFDTLSEQLDHSVYFGTNGDLPEELEPDTLYINDRINFYSERIGRRLYLNESFKLNEEELIVRAHTSTILTNTTKETVTVESSLLKELPESVPPVGVDFNALADKMYEMKHFYQFYSVDEFPIEGEERFLYLAQFKNEAPEGDDEKWEASNALYKWDTELNDYELISAGGAGGGGGGGDGGSRTRLTPYPIGSPTSLNVSYGTEVTVQYNYTNSIYTTGSRGIYVNDILVNTKNISTGVNTEDITQYLRTGLNTVRFRVSDPEGTASALIYTINMDTVVFTSLFDDSIPNIGTPFSIPFNINTSAQIRELYVKVDGIDKPMRTVTGTAGLEIISGLTHGAHDVEMYVIARFLNAENVEVYSIQSNTLRFALIYDDGISTDRIITSKFNITESTQGENLNIDYVVYDPEQETSPVSLYINSELFNSLTVDRTRHFWNIRTLPIGTHTLRIESGSTYVDKVVQINPTEIVVEVIKDEFLKLYMTAEGKTNSDENRDDWDNSYGAPVDVNLTNLNYVSNGWIDNSLRLSKDSSAEIIYKAFDTEVTTAGKTIELDFRTRFSLDVNTPLLTSMNGGIGFEITPQRATLYGSNVTAIANFKEEEHLRISFVINPVERFITTYVNGIITGVDNFFNNTRFRQISPANILLNPEDGSLDVYSIRVYDRALTPQEILSNQIAEITDPLEKVEAYKFNDIYDSFGNINMDKIASIIPIMKIEGSPLPDSKIRPRRFVDVYFEHPFEPDKNFERTGRTTDIDAQGTSSLQYPVKNYKIRLDQALSSSQRKKYQMEDNMIPERVFTLKADYMDSSHANNTGLAKLFDTIYDENIPPKEFDERVRTTVYGYPIALFHRINPTDPWTYKGVYNFNLDKDAEDSVGLNNEDEWEEGNPASVFPENQSFEITFNSDSGAGAFKVSDLNGMISSFEPRYPELDAFDIFEDENISAEQMMEEVKEHMLTLTTDPAILLEIDESTTPEELIDIWDANFTSLENYAYIEAFRDLRDHYANLRAAIQWVIDNVNSNNFKTQFDQHFNRDSALKYLISTLVFGLVDNLGKNAMVNTWDGNIWYFNFYDIDTALGLENQGRNIHDYDIEIGDPGAYATADSNMWIGILNHFGTELISIYSGLRQEKYDYDNILEFLNEQQIDKIPESLYNADAFAKYIGVTTAWLWMAQGNRLEHIKRWLTLRLAYLDSKFQYGDYLDNNIAIRMNVDDYTDATIDLTPIISQYVGVRFGNVGGGIIINERTKQRETTTISAPSAAGSGITNMEVWIYGANWLGSIGDISNLYPSSISTDSADKLTELIIGNQSVGYDNDKLTQVSVGNNIYLEKVDVSNCSILGTNVGTGSTEVLDLSLAENIREVYAQGTQLKGVSLAPGAPIEILKLPASTTELVLRNHNNLTDEFFEIQGTPELNSLRIENCPGIDSIDLIQYLAPNGAVRITNIELVTNKTSFLDDLVDMLEGRQGIDSFGNIVSTPVLTGTITIYTGADFDQSFYQSKLPNIIFNHIILPEGLTYTFSGGNAQITGYTGNAATLVIPESVPQGLDGVDYVLGSNVQIRTVNVLGGTNTISTIIQNIFIPDTVIATSGTPLASGFAGRIMTSHSEKPAGWNISYENILYNERPFIQAEDFFVRIYNNNTEIELLTMVGSNIELVTVPRSVEGLTITSIPAYTILGIPLSIYIPDSITSVLPSLSTISFVLTESSEQDGYVTGDNVTWDISDSLKTYTVTYNYLDDSTDTYTQTWYAFVGIDSLIGARYYVNDIEIDIPYVSTGNTSIDTYEIPDYRTFSYIGTSYTLDSVFIDISEPLGSYILIIPDQYDDGINGLKVCNPSSTLFTDENFPATSRDRIKEIYYYSNITNSTVIPGFTDSTSNNTTYGFLGKPNFSYRTKLELYTKKTAISKGMRGGSATKIIFTSPSLDFYFASERTMAFGDNTLSLSSVHDILNLISQASSNRRIGSFSETNLTSGYGYFTANSLTGELVIPYGIELIGAAAFSGEYGSAETTNKLTSVVIPSSVTGIGANAFTSNNITGNLVLLNSITEIGDYAFRFNSITNVTLPNQLTILRNYVFDSNDIESLMIPDTVLTIGNFAFGSNQISELTIPNSVTTIGQYAFRSNPLTTLTLGSGLVSIGGSAFFNLSSGPQISTITIYATTPPTLGTTVFYKPQDITCYVPSGSVTAYQAATGWSAMTIVAIS